MEETEMNGRRKTIEATKMFLEEKDEAMQFLFNICLSILHNLKRVLIE